MNRLYFLQRQPQWKELRHWASGAEWVEVGGPVVVDGFTMIGTASSITVRIDRHVSVLRWHHFDALTIAKLVTLERGRRSADLLVIAEPWGDQEVRGELETFEYLRKWDARRAATLVSA